jgi:hypothetical protein
MKTLIRFMKKVKSMAQSSKVSGSWQQFGKTFKTEKKASSRPVAA